MRAPKAWLVAAIGGLLLVAGCTSKGNPAVIDSTVTHTVTHAAPRPTPGTPSAQPTGPLPAGAITSADRECPYIDKQSAADQEGNRIGRVAVLSAGGKPVGCQFFFDPNWGAPRMTMEIMSTRYRTATGAYNAMIRTGQTGGNPSPVKDLVPGVDAMLYQAAFYAPDGAKDWACTFAKGAVLVTVKTDQTNVSFNARSVAATVAPKF